MKIKTVTNFLTALALSLTVFATGTYAATDPEKVKVLNRAELDALLAHPEQLVIVDLRRPDELASIGGFPVYLNIQVNELERQLAWIPKERTVVAVSNHNSRSRKGAAALIDAGFKVAGAIGAQNYEEQGGKLIKIAPPAPKPKVTGSN